MKTLIRKNTFKTSYIILFGLMMGLASTSIYSQTNPFREYTNPDEIVTFDRSTSYTEAIEVINQFVQEYENKFIVDLSGYTGSIGVSLPPMHWKDALNYILEIQNLQLVQKPDYYEIIVPEVTEGSSGESGAGGAAGGLPGVDALADIDTREIRINATFFEGNRRALQEIGIDWSTLTSDVPANIQDFVGTEADESIPQTAFSDQFVSVNSSNANQVSQNVFNALVNLGEIGPGISVQALFSTFESNNLGSIIATPSIKVVDGQEGKIQDGQDFSVKQRDFAGNVTDEFFSTGTILTVTPTIINYNDSTFIHLDIAAERSNAQPDAVSTIIRKQQVTTKALLLDGEATAVAGLYTTSETKIRRGVPILKDLPAWFFGLKYLFGYNSTDRIENELVIIVQAELEKTLAERMNEKMVSKGTILSNERDRFRNEMDYVIDQEEAKFPVRDDEPDTSTTTSPQEQLQMDTPVEDTSTQPDENKTVAGTDTLTIEQKEELKELSMPINNPELMVVVPKAFDLDEYLRKREQGEIIEETNTDLKYFVIGGSFIVPNNATNFSKTLDEQGYESRILFHSSTRFNYVAYSAFSNFDEAVEVAKRMRSEENPGTWIFTLQPDIEIKKGN